MHLPKTTISSIVDFEIQMVTFVNRVVHTKVNNLKSGKENFEKICGHYEELHARYDLLIDLISLQNN